MNFSTRIVALLIVAVVAQALVIKGRGESLHRWSMHPGLGFTVKQDPAEVAPRTRTALTADSRSKCVETKVSLVRLPLLARRVHGTVQVV